MLMEVFEMKAVTIFLSPVLGIGALTQAPREPQRLSRIDSWMCISLMT
jgi:hypothetical protein